MTGYSQSLTPKGRALFTSIVVMVVGPEGQKVPKVKRSQRSKGSEWKMVPKVRRSHRSKGFEGQKVPKVKRSKGQKFPMAQKSKCEMVKRSRSKGQKVKKSKV